MSKFEAKAEAVLAEGKFERDVYGTEINSHLYIKKDSDGDYTLTNTLDNTKIYLTPSDVKKLIKELK